MRLSRIAPLVFVVLFSAAAFAAELPTWNMAGFKFRRISRPKDPKAEIGMLPPS